MEPTKLPRLIPLTDWPKHHAWPPLGGLRHLAFFRETNGFKRCVRQVGRRLLIDEAEFFAWVAEQNGADNAPTTPAGAREAA